VLCRGVVDLDLKFEALRCLGGGVESQRNVACRRLLLYAHDQSKAEVVDVSVCFENA
jgi:hypothetical protein